MKIEKMVEIGWVSRKRMEHTNYWIFQDYTHRFGSYYDYKESKSICKWICQCHPVDLSYEQICVNFRSRQSKYFDEDIENNMRTVNNCNILLFIRLDNFYRPFLFCLVIISENHKINIKYFRKIYFLFYFAIRIESDQFWNIIIWK